MEITRKRIGIIGALADDFENDGEFVKGDKYWSKALRVLCLTTKEQIEDCKVDVFVLDLTGKSWQIIRQLAKEGTNLFGRPVIFYGVPRDRMEEKLRLGGDICFEVFNPSPRRLADAVCRVIDPNHLMEKESAKYEEFLRTAPLPTPLVTTGDETVRTETAA